MALKPCRECNKSVSSEAVTCPNCGVPNPTKKKLTKNPISFRVKTTKTALGIETAGGIFTEIIKKGTVIPEKMAQIFSTSENNQSSVEIKILRGNSKKAIENELVEVFTINNIPPAPKGVPRIEVTFAIDENANIYIRSKDLGTNKIIEKEIGKIKTEEVVKNYRDKENKSNIQHTASSNFLKNFWSGNKGLGFSFWCIFIFGNFLLNILFLLFITDEKIIWLMYIVIVVWNVFAVMSVFNSASIYEKEKLKSGKPYGWAMTAKTVTVLLILSGIGNALRYFR